MGAKITYSSGRRASATCGAPAAAVRAAKPATSTSAPRSCWDPGAGTKALWSSRPAQAATSSRAGAEERAMLPRLRGHGAVLAARGDLSL